MDQPNILQVYENDIQIWSYFIEKRIVIYINPLAQIFLLAIKKFMQRYLWNKYQPLK